MIQAIPHAKEAPALQAPLLLPPAPSGSCWGGLHPARPPGNSGGALSVTAVPRRLSHQGEVQGAQFPELPLWGSWLAAGQTERAPPSMGAPFGRFAPVGAGALAGPPLRETRTPLRAAGPAGTNPLAGPGPLRPFPIKRGFGHAEKEISLPEPPIWGMILSEPVFTTDERRPGGLFPPYCVAFPCLMRKLLVHPASPDYEYRFSRNQKGCDTVRKKLLRACLISRRVWIGEWIFCPARQKSAGILTDGKDF